MKGCPTVRLAYLPIFVLMTATAPAYAGSDSADVPNPFTEQAGSSANITSVDKGVSDFSRPVQAPEPQQGQAGSFSSEPPDQSGKSGSSDSFYQSTKKDTDSH